MVRKITPAYIISTFIYDYESSHYLEEIATSLKKSHQTIKPHLERLVQENILTKNVRKGITEYALNMKEKRIYDFLTISEKETLLERLDTDTLIKLLYEKLSPFFENNTFILFGSATEHIKKGSDIDILMIGNGDITQTLSEFEKVYNKKIHLIKIKSIQLITPTLLQEIYKKHLIFNNTEKIIRLFGGLYEQHNLV